MNKQAKANGEALIARLRSGGVAGGEMSDGRIL